MPGYETFIKVRFGDVDHAGIVYYPRIFDYLHRAFEEFFADRAGIPYFRVIDERRVGFPSVHAEADFRGSLAYGDVARVTMEVERIGESSVTIRYRVRKEDGGRDCVSASVTTACVDMDGFRARPIPDDLRAVFSRHQADD